MTRALLLTLNGRVFSTQQELQAAVLPLYNINLASFPPDFSYRELVESAVEKGWILSIGSAIIVSVPDEATERAMQLQCLLDAWETETRDTDLLHGVVSHPAYRNIVRGYATEESVPWILRRFIQHPDFRWICMLVDIVGRHKTSTQATAILAHLMPLLHKVRDEVPLSA